jgi:inorganic triphosphatase YgiF
LLRAPQGSVVEWAFDVGDITAGDNSTPIVELELELLSGPVAGLFTVARNVIAEAPVRLLTQSKADRGYALATGKKARWYKAKSVPLARDVTAEDALAETLALCIDHLALNEECVLTRTHIEGVHQMRVALRRLRSALHIYRQLLPETDYRRLNDKAKACIDVLGPARDWDVFLAEVLPPVAEWISDEPSLSLLREHAEKRREQAYTDAQAMIRSPDYATTLLDLGEWVHNRAWRNQDLSEESSRLLGPAIDLGRDILERRHRKLIKAGKHIKTMTVAERHKLRIAVKKQRYAAEFFADLFPAKKVKAYVRRMVALQDHLGLLNDIATAGHLTKGLIDAAHPTETAGLAYGAGLIVGWQEQELQRHEAALFKDWNNLKDQSRFW